MRLAGFLLTAAIASTAAAQADSIRIDGSTGVMPLVKALAAEYRGGPVAFGAGLGSSVRLEAVRLGRIDIALASHGIVVADVERQGLSVHHVADVPVGFGVHPSTGVGSLTEAQICDIYAGRVTNWKQVGGADLPIAAATRPKGEVDGDVVTGAIPCVATPHATVVSKEKPEDMAAFLAATTGAIGMTTSTVAGQSGGRIVLVSLGGVAPMPDNLRANRYRLTRESFLVTRREPTAAVSSFLVFVRSPAGARVIGSTGAVPR
jgi:phosphate transport system substrate-binding protein